MQAELKILEELRNGSDQAYKRVYLDNRDSFINFARKFDINREEVLDIYQDAYIAFYENIRNGKLTELRSSLSTYLISIGKYMILDRLRKIGKRHRGPVPLDRLEDDDPVIPVIDEYDDLTPRQKLLQQHFEQLGEKCQSILTWFYYRKFNIRQIMEAGGYKSENVVKSQKSRCLKTLKESMLKLS